MVGKGGWYWQRRPAGGQEFSESNELVPLASFFISKACGSELKR